MAENDDLMSMCTVANDYAVCGCVCYVGTFHLLHMLVDDYIMHTIESMREKEEEAKHLNRINRLRQGTVCGCECVVCVCI